MKMIRINYYLRPFTLIMALLFLTTCDDLIEDSPEDRVLIDAFFTAPSDAEATLIGAYNQTFRSDVYTNFLFFDNRASDDLTAPLDGEPSDPLMFRPNLNSGNGNVSGLYASSYNALANINLIIEEVRGMDDGLFFDRENPSQNRKKQILGEAMFLRAFVYYYLVFYWGDVPLILEYPKSEDPRDYLLPRTPAAEIYTQIMQDLDSAEAYLPLNHDQLAADDPALNAEDVQSKGRATKGAAMLLKARIYLQEQRWQEAIDKAREIINLGEYQMETTWRNIFSAAGSGPTVNQNSTESILEIQSLAGAGQFNNTGGYAWFHQDGRPRRGATLEAFNLYDGTTENPADVRRVFSMSQRTDNPNQIYAIKYANAFPWWDPENGDIFNFVPMRLTEVYLIIAEALNELNGPNAESLQILNTIRGRAFDPDIPTTGIPPYTLPADQATFRDMIREERRRELMFEGHAFYDLRRYDSYDGGTRSLESLGLTAGENEGRVLLPIPQNEIDFYTQYGASDLLPQNEDY